MDCILSSRIETLLFNKENSINNPEEIPDDECPICLSHLSIEFPSCCGSYSRKLKCGHWIHVYCQINRNPERHKCSLCRKEIISKKYLNEIIREYERYHYGVFPEIIISKIMDKNKCGRREAIDKIWNLKGNWLLFV